MSPNPSYDFVQFTSGWTTTKTTTSTSTTTITTTTTTFVWDGSHFHHNIRFPSEWISTENVFSDRECPNVGSGSSRSVLAFQVPLLYVALNFSLIYVTKNPLMACHIFF